MEATPSKPSPVVALTDRPKGVKRRRRLRLERWIRLRSEGFCETFPAVLTIAILVIVLYDLTLLGISLK